MTTLFDLPAVKPRERRSIAGIDSPAAITHDWITPKFIIDALGPFDLDPCESKTQPWPCARRGIVWPTDGLTSPWEGRVWLNPPYSVHAAAWLDRLANHVGGGIALTFARTETVMFHKSVFGVARAVMFLKGRLKFHLPSGKAAEANAGGPSCLIAYSEKDAECLRASKLAGFVALAK